MYDDSNIDTFIKSKSDMNLGLFEHMIKCKIQFCLESEQYWDKMINDFKNHAFKNPQEDVLGRNNVNYDALCSLMFSCCPASTILSIISLMDEINWISLEKAL